jgi:hypothetical protein
VTPSLQPGIRAERDFLAMCVAAPALGGPALASLDPDQLLTSETLRRAARHLTDHLSSPLAELPRDDDELSRVVADLVERAGGGKVTADKLEHSRLLLELARLDREIARARGLRQPGISALARERQEVRDQLGHIAARIEKPH